MTTDTSTSTAPVETDRAAPKQATLGEAFRFFSTKATPRIIVPVLLVAIAGRVLVGDLGGDDLLVVAVLLALEPFIEWTTHVFILHFKPRVIAGRTFDIHAAKKHRHHHRHPHDPATAFVPLADLFGLGVIVLGLLALGTWGDGGRLLTAIVTALLILLTYEWTHFLIHTAYKPQGRYYRYIWRAHRLHHFKNEHYWMGVTIHLADHLLGTFPQKSEVDNSPTARTLGIDS